MEREEEARDDGENGSGATAMAAVAVAVVWHRDNDDNTINGARKVEMVVVEKGWGWWGRRKKNGGDGNGKRMMETIVEWR